MLPPPVHVIISPCDTLAGTARQARFTHVDYSWSAIVVDTANKAFDCGLCSHNDNTKRINLKGCMRYRRSQGHSYIPNVEDQIIFVLSLLLLKTGNIDQLQQCKKVWKFKQKQGRYVNCDSLYADNVSISRGKQMNPQMSLQTNTRPEDDRKQKCAMTESWDGES